MHTLVSQVSNFSSWTNGWRRGYIVFGYASGVRRRRGCGSAGLMQMGNPRPNLELVVVLYFDGSCDVEWSKNDSGCSNIAQSSDPASLQFSLSCSHPRALVAPATVAASMSLSATRMRIPAVTKASSPAQIIRSRSTVASTSASMLDAKSRVRDHARKISGSSVREATTTNSVYVALCCAHLPPPSQTAHL